MVEPNILLDALLSEAGLSHAGLAARVNAAGRASGLALRYDRTAVTRWIGGQRPRGEVPDLIRQILCREVRRPLSLGDIGMPPRAAHGGTTAPLPAFVDTATALWRSDERRRPAVRNAVPLTGTEAVIPVWEWENPPEDRDVSRGGRDHIGMADVAMLRAARSHFEGLYRSAGGLATRERITGFLTAEAAPMLRGAYGDAVGRRLHHAVAGLVGIAGICAYDADAFGLAQRYFHQALRLAKASNDRRLGACVVGMLVYQSLWLRDFRQAVAFAETALRSAGPAITPALAADLYAMQAKAYGQLGDPAGVTRCARLAEAAESRIRVAEEPAETGYVQPGLVDVQLAEAHLGLGALGPARTHAARAAALPAHPRGRVHRLAVLAHVELRGGRADEAAALAAAMVEEGRGMESLRLRDRFREVRRHLAACDGAESVRAVELLDDALRVPL